jgi:hypothetical protein
MSQTKEAIREQLCRTIATTLRCSGHEPPQFKDGEKPLRDYESFDSHCGLEVTVGLEAAFGIDDLGNNFFIEGTGKAAQARSLSEIVDYIFAALMGAKKGRSS